MKKLAVVFFLFFSVLTANASSQWMWHGAFPWVYSHAESSWWYMKAGTDGKFLAWKQSDQKWYYFNEASKNWFVLNKAGDTLTIPDLSLEMIWVEAGTFTMGSPSSEAGRGVVETQHEVTLTNGFWLGKYEVTQSQWERVMGSNPSRYKGGDRPVETVSWADVTSFCAKLTALERTAGRLPAGMAYQLPTEAQWEYACRAGTTTAYSFGNELTSSQANVHVLGPHESTDVGKYPANAWGFHGMHGNVSEWCADWFGLYPEGAVRDPVGHVDGIWYKPLHPYRVIRGGDWVSSPRTARSAHRQPKELVSSSALGFRLSLRPASQ